MLKEQRRRQIRKINFNIELESMLINQSGIPKNKKCNIRAEKYIFKNRLVTENNQETEYISIEKCSKEKRGKRM